jgi:hypothetical protein
MSVEKFAAELINIFTSAATARKKSSVGDFSSLVDLARNHAIAEAFEVASKAVTEVASKIVDVVTDDSNEESKKSETESQ